MLDVKSGRVLVLAIVTAAILAGMAVIITLRNREPMAMQEQHASSPSNGAILKKAIEDYRAMQGHLPLTLDELLESGILKEPPLNPDTQKPVRFLMPSGDPPRVEGSPGDWLYITANWQIFSGGGDISVPGAYYLMSRHSDDDMFAIDFAGVFGLQPTSVIRPEPQDDPNLTPEQVAHTGVEHQEEAAQRCIKQLSDRKS